MIWVKLSWPRLHFLKASCTFAVQEMFSRSGERDKKEKKDGCAILEACRSGDGVACAVGFPGTGVSISTGPYKSAERAGLAVWAVSDCCELAQTAAGHASFSQWVDLGFDGERLCRNTGSHLDRAARRGSVAAGGRALDAICCFQF